MNKSPSKSTLFLIEMIIAILFFSFSSAICVGLFAKGNNLSTGSSDLNQALLTVQSVAETLKAASPKDGLIINQAVPIDEDRSVIYYDRDWQITTNPAQSTFQIELSTTRTGQLFTTVVKASKGQSAICELSVKKYRP